MESEVVGLFGKLRTAVDWKYWDEVIYEPKEPESRQLPGGRVLIRCFEYQALFDSLLAKCKVQK